MAGLEHRLKGIDRLREKVDAEVASGGGLSVDEVFPADALRYTHLVEHDCYDSGVAQARAALHQAGYRQVEVQEFLG